MSVAGGREQEKLLEPHDEGQEGCAELAGSFAGRVNCLRMFLFKRKHCRSLPPRMPCQSCDALYLQFGILLWNVTLCLFMLAQGEIRSRTPGPWILPD